MIDRRPTRFQAFTLAASRSISVALPSGLVSAGAAKALSIYLGLDAAALAMMLLFGALGTLAPILFLVPRDYMAIRDAETRSDREFREKAMLHKLAKRYPGEVNDL